MVAGCGIGFATGFGMQDMYDFSDPYLQNTFGMWGERLAECSAKIQKNPNPYHHVARTFNFPPSSFQLSKNKRSNAIYPIRPILESWILLLRKNIKKTNPPLVAFFLRVLIMARPAPNLAVKTWLIMCHWAGQKERLHMFSRNWAAIMQNEFYKSRVLPMNHIRLENLATNQYKL